MNLGHQECRPNVLLMHFNSLKFAADKWHLRKGGQAYVITVTDSRKNKEQISWSPVFGPNLAPDG